MATRCVILCALVLAGQVGTGAAQQVRVIHKPVIARLRGDSTRPRVLTRISPGKTDTLRGRIDSLRLRPGQVIAVTLDTTSPATLPFRYLSTDSAAATTLYLRPAVEIEPLAYAGAAREFRGALHVGLEDSLDPAASHRLASPIRFLLNGDRVSVTPSALSLKHTNLPFERVRLTAASPGESVRVHIRPGFNPRGVDVWVPVERPAIALEPVTPTVTGLGLAVAIVHVTLPPEAGTTPRVVRLTAKHAIPEPSELTLAGGETRDAKVRSVGIGTDTLYARSDPFHSDRVVIVYGWPVRFFAAALLGGLLGSVVAGYGARRRGKGTSPPAYGVGGLATGLLVAIAFAVGLNLTGLEMVTQYGEAVVFVVAALGALLGLPGIGKAVPVLGRALEGRAR